MELVQLVSRIDIGRPQYKKQSAPQSACRWTGRLLALLLDFSSGLQLAWMWGSLLDSVWVE